MDLIEALAIECGILLHGAHVAVLPHYGLVYLPQTTREIPMPRGRNPILTPDEEKKIRDAIKS